MKKYLIPALCLSLLSPLALTGCTPVGAAVGAGSAVGVGAMQERGFKQSAKDTFIEAEINRLLFSKGVDDYFRPLSVTVHEGRVLLAGNMQSDEYMVEAIRIAWTVDGVKEVINEIKVQNDVGFIQDSEDVITTTKLRSKLMFDKQVSAINYSIEVIDGTVYLMGIAKSQDELNRVIAQAEGTGGVKKVISYVRVEGAPTTDQVTAAPVVPVTPTENKETTVDEVKGGASMDAAPGDPITFEPVNPKSTPPTDSVDQNASPVEFVN